MKIQMTNKRVFEYEPIPGYCGEFQKGTEKIFTIGVFCCTVTKADCILGIECMRGNAFAQFERRMKAPKMRDVARMLLSAADEMDAMQATKQKG